MKKMIILSILLLTGLYADALTDMVVSQAKTEATNKVVAEVVGDTSITKAVASGVSADSLKDEAIKQAKDKAVDVVADEASKAVGTETIDKATAKTVINSAL